MSSTPEPERRSGDRRRGDRRVAQVRGRRAGDQVPQYELTQRLIRWYAGLCLAVGALFVLLLVIFYAGRLTIAQQDRVSCMTGGRKTLLSVKLAYYTSIARREDARTATGAHKASDLLLARQAYATAYGLNHLNPTQFTLQVPVTRKGRRVITEPLGRASLNCVKAHPDPSFFSL